MNMQHREAVKGSTTEGIAVAPSMAGAMAREHIGQRWTGLDRRAVFICTVAMVIAAAAAVIAEVLVHLIALVTNLSFFGRFSTQVVSPSEHHLGLWVIPIPVIGGLIVGVMARYGSAAIRGHGIPEAMEQVLTNESRIPPKITWLKPLSSAIAIGTGGPFGAEGPIIATGGALGSMIGQWLHTTAVERKTLLAAGAAAGMSATFGAPVSAVLLAVELLLFEFRARSFVPVALAAVVAAGVRAAMVGVEPMFPMPDLSAPTGAAIAVYIAIGALVGLLSVPVTKAVYWIEDTFEHLPVHWMWWPAIGAVAVGVVGYFAPRTLGVGYSNISGMLSGGVSSVVNDLLKPQHILVYVAFVVVMKFLSWSISLGSGTSGGTLAPLFTIGSGTGLLLGSAVAMAAPWAHVDARIGALVGMAAIFAGASRALLASAVFAFETTLQPLGLLPLMGGCTAAYLVSSLLMRNTIMTEKIARRGVTVPSEYSADLLEGIAVMSAASREVVTLEAGKTVGSIREWVSSGSAGAAHQGFPVVDESGRLIGVVTRRSLFDNSVSADQPLRALVRREPIVVTAEARLREAADLMVEHDIGRLPVVGEQGKVVGFLTRSDLLSAERRRLKESRERKSHLRG